MCGQYHKKSGMSLYYATLNSFIVQGFAKRTPPNVIGSVVTIEVTDTDFDDANVLCWRLKSKAFHRMKKPVKMI